MTRFFRAALAVSAVAAAAFILRRLRRLADPDPSVYGHPVLPGKSGP